DTGNQTIRKINQLGLVSTLAGSSGNVGKGDGVGAQAQFISPTGVAVDRAGNVYVADSRNFAIRKITPEGRVTTFAGSPEIPGPKDKIKFGHASLVTTFAGSPEIPGNTDGPAALARFGAGSKDLSAGPSALVIDRTGNLYVADTGNGSIRKITPEG